MCSKDNPIDYIYMGIRGLESKGLTVTNIILDVETYQQIELNNLRTTVQTTEPAHVFNHDMCALHCLPDNTIVFECKYPAVENSVKKD